MDSGYPFGIFKLFLYSLPQLCRIFVGIQLASESLLLPEQNVGYLLSESKCVTQGASEELA